MTKTVTTSTGKTTGVHVSNKYNNQQWPYSTIVSRANEAMRQMITNAEQAYIRDGVNFSRIQLADVLQARDKGLPVEFETFAPYLAYYVANQGTMTTDTLIPEDAIGLALAASFRRVFPQARMISLYDEFNTTIRDGKQKPVEVHFTRQMIKNFRASLVTLLQSVGAISQDAVEDKEYLLIPESEKVADAEVLVAKLEAKGHIQRHGQEVAFINERAENPFYQRIRLRSAHGRWLCEALDAAGYLKAENKNITHIVVLPNYMRSQQDKMWEILRILGISHYHNIFFDHTKPLRQIVQAIESFFKSAE